MSDWTDRHCNRRFYPLTPHPASGRVGVGAGLMLPDLVSLHHIKEDTAGDGSFADTWAAADYLLEPYNAAPEQHWGVPYTAGAGAWQWDADELQRREQRFELSGIWGYRQFKERSGAALNGS